MTHILRMDFTYLRLVRLYPRASSSSDQKWAPRAAITIGRRARIQVLYVPETHCAHTLAFRLTVLIPEPEAGILTA